ncbi:MAG: hypothetical protein H6825_15000 [Planctomycetes bacterium]|nr:hypothetical protein [Planctomycetota bacterium]
MDPVLVGLAILAALVVGGSLLLVRRLDALDERLGRLDDIDGLARRVQRLAAELDRKELNAQIQTKLTEVGEAERRLGAAVGELRQQIDELTERIEAGLSGPGRRPEGLELGATEIVRRHLEDEGFQSVRVLSDLTRLDGLTGRVVFEATRRGAMHKGHVSLRDGVIDDETIRAAYSAFP